MKGRESEREKSREQSMLYLESLAYLLLTAALLTIFTSFLFGASFFRSFL